MTVCRWCGLEIRSYKLDDGNEDEVFIWVSGPDDREKMMCPDNQHQHEPEPERKPR